MYYLVRVSWRLGVIDREDGARPLVLASRGFKVPLLRLLLRPAAINPQNVSGLELPVLTIGDFFSRFGFPLPFRGHVHHHTLTSSYQSH